ncbi:hypothetical protein B0H11DRAFT_1974041 [Mycena galericulata]|nr:hypothetical protein B0H11DRAFT_1974041 [Mycena galericulata]
MDATVHPSPFNHTSQCPFLDLLWLGPPSLFSQRRCLCATGFYPAMALCVFTIAPVTSSRCIRLHLCLCCRSFVEYSASFSWSVGVLCASWLLIWDHPCGCSHRQMAPHLAR